MRRILIIISFVIVLLGAVGIAGAEGYHQYQDLKSHAYSAESHLLAAQDKLKDVVDSKDLAQIGKAQAEFSSARQEFAEIARQIESLGVFYSIAERMPVVGADVRAARKLTRAGQHVSEAGEEACLAATSITETEGKGGERKSTEMVFAAIPSASAHLSRALAAIDSAQEEYKGLSKEGLSPLLTQALTTLENQVPKQRALLQSGLNALRIVHKTLGGDGEQVYLILVQDAAELRPTGGFIGNYGIIKFRDGKIVQISFDDTFQPDWAYYGSGKAPPLVDMFARYFPQAMFWGLRDANIWPDFERSAKQAAWFAVTEGVVDKVDGVIGITDSIVDPLMKAVGPIDIPEYGETVNQENVLEKIRFYQDPNRNDRQGEKVTEETGNNRKVFTSLVLKAIVERVNGIDMPGLINLALSLQDSFKTKAVQIYFSEPELQKLAEDYDVSGQMKMTNGDYLWVVDMNLGWAKDNLYVKPSISYTASISTTDEMISDLEITYDYTKMDLLPAMTTLSQYADYLRIYVPPGSKLLEEDGTDEPVETFNEEGKTVFATYFKLPQGKVKRLRLRYGQQPKLATAEGKTRYELLVQKQAGNNVQMFEATVILPESAKVDDRGAFEQAGNRLSYRRPLPFDISLNASFVTR